MACNVVRVEVPFINGSTAIREWRGDLEMSVSDAGILDVRDYGLRGHDPAANCLVYAAAPGAWLRASCNPVE